MWSLLYSHGPGYVLPDQEGCVHSSDNPNICEEEEAEAEKKGKEDEEQGVKDEEEEKEEEEEEEEEEENAKSDQGKEAECGKKGQGEAYSG